MEYIWEAKGHEQLIAGANNSREIVLVHLDRALRKVSKLIVGNGKGSGALGRATPRGVTGRLRNSTVGEILGQGENLRLEVRQGAQNKGVFYGSVIREGRTWSRMPPYRVLIPWVEVVLGISGKQAPRVAYMIARKIKNKGINVNPYHERVLEASKSGIQTIVTDEGVNIWGRLSGRGG